MKKRSIIRYYIFPSETKAEYELSIAELRK
jgi:hypothetical protein